MEELHSMHFPQCLGIRVGMLPAPLLAVAMYTHTSVPVSEARGMPWPSRGDDEVVRFSPSGMASSV
eukprot:5414137-Alexandrium_andersonii.AAC.1